MTSIEETKQFAHALLELHRRFLENERHEAEKILNKKLTPFAYWQILTQDDRFKWMQPFSALVAEIDAFVEELKEEPTRQELEWVKDQVTRVLNLAKISERIEHYQNNDPDFAVLLSRVRLALNQFKTQKGLQ